MRDLGAMTFAAADKYRIIFAEQESGCESIDTHPLLRVLIGGGWGNNKRVNLLVKEEDYDKAKAIFDALEKEHAKRVEELSPAADRAMAMIAIVAILGVVLFYCLTRMK